MPISETNAAQSAEEGVPPNLSFRYPDAELVFGVVCAVGGNYRRVEKELVRLLKQYRYKPEVIRISEFLKDAGEDFGVELPLSTTPEFDRIQSHMDVGNDARGRTRRPELMALRAISDIHSRRSRIDGVAEPRKRHAYIVLTLKRPEEVDVLRRVYGPAFFLIGVFASERERLDYLKDDHGMTEPQAEGLVRQDEEDEHQFGQRTRETFHQADVFVRLVSNGYKQQLKRFLDLVFRHPYHTPCEDEHAMFLAYSSSLRSAQLGRQVGASITSEHGDLISVGCNEVPRAGGGSYWPGEHDCRDHILKKDSNDERKRAIASDIVDKLSPILKEGQYDNARDLLTKSMLFDITEFGRAVHAEMDAILSCARSGVSTRSATLYTTTFPCHNCTRHIVAAGIARVVFIEPYPKSLARNLHEDSMRIEESGDPMPKGRRIPFEPFVGIGPRRYADLFSTKLAGGFSIERKRNGEVVPWSESAGSPRISVQPISYLQREQLAAEDLELLRKEARDGGQEHLS